RSVKIERGHSGVPHTNLRTVTASVTLRPPQGTSATVRSYLPWTRSEACPQRGQTASFSTHATRTVTCVAVGYTASTTMVSGRRNTEASNSVSTEPIDAALLSSNLASNCIDGNLPENRVRVQASMLTYCEDEPFSVIENIQ